MEGGIGNYSVMPHHIIIIEKTLNLSVESPGFALIVCH